MKNEKNTLKKHISEQTAEAAVAKDAPAPAESAVLQDTPAPADSFSEKLLRWYEANRRILPWREDPSPYHVWLSEIMLQQTRVEAVKEYYKRFLRELPDIAALAGAEEDVYNKLWEGLGYYSRVRNLHKGAQMVMHEYDGVLPSTAAELKKIAGIGPYTSSAIASIAFGERVPAVDGNLLRVFARLTAYGENIKDKAAFQAAYDFFLECMPERQTASFDNITASADSSEASDAASIDNITASADSSEASDAASVHANPCGNFNQALMDLGATVCLPNSAPLCDACPFVGICKAHALHDELSFPVMPEKKSRKIEEYTVFVIHDGEKIVLHKRPAAGLLAGLYEYPNVPGRLDENAAVSYLDNLGFPALRIKKLPDARHIFTHKEWLLHGWEVRADELRFLDGRISDESDISSFILAETSEIIEKYSIPTAFRIVWEPDTANT